MSSQSVVIAAPFSVRVAGILVAIQGLAGFGFAVAVLLRAPSSGPGVGNAYGEVGYFAVLSIGVLAVAVGLLTGHGWSRTPAAVLQILLIGVAWYAIGPSGQPAVGLPVAALCVVTLVLLFTAKARAWAVRDPAPAEAAETGPAAPTPSAAKQARSKRAGSRKPS